MKKTVIPYEGFKKNKSGSATLGESQAEQREIFGVDREYYIRRGQGKSKSWQKGTHSHSLKVPTRSGSSGGQSQQPVEY